MTPQQILGLGIRLLALFLVFSAIRYLTFSASEMFPTGVKAQASVAYLIASIYLVLAALLWFLPMWLAQKILPRTRFENRIEVQGLELARVGCSLIGLWLLAEAWPSTVWFLFKAFLLVGNESFFNVLNADAKMDMAINFLQLAFSILLIVRSGDFARFVFRKNQNTSNSKEEQSPLTLT